MVAPFREARVSAAGEVRWTRVAVVAFAAVSAWWALDPPGDIVEITIFSGSLYAVCFFPAVVLGLHWRRGSATAVLASMFAGVSVLLAWIAAGLTGTVHEVFPALLASLMVYVGVSLGGSPRTSPQSPDRSGPGSPGVY